MFRIQKLAKFLQARDNEQHLKTKESKNERKSERPKGKSISFICQENQSQLNEIKEKERQRRAISKSQIIITENQMREKKITESQTQSGPNSLLSLLEKISMN